VPRWPLRLPRSSGADGVLRARSGTLRRLLHVDGRPVWLTARQPASAVIVLSARAAGRDAAEYGIERMRFALGVDDDLRPFHERFRHDGLIGRALRAQPWLRLRRRPEPFEALAWAICEQLIEFERAAAIERRIVAQLGRRCGCCGLRDLPTAAVLAGTAPAQLCALDLAPRRALALVRAAREVAAGRIDLHAADPQRAWARLRAIPDIGAWTVECLATLGQGRNDVLPAGDLAYRKLVGRLRDGHPAARAQEDEVRDFFAPYHPWAGLAGAYALRARHGRGALAMAGC